MANVSSSNGLEKYPKLRFNGFSEPWKSVRIGDVYAERSRYARDFLHLVGMLRHDRLSAHGEDPVRTVVDRNRIRDAVDERRRLAQIISCFAQRVLQLWCHRPSPPNHAGILQAVRCGAAP